MAHNKETAYTAPEAEARTPPVASWLAEDMVEAAEMDELNTDESAAAAEAEFVSPPEPTNEFCTGVATATAALEEVPCMDCVELATADVTTEASLIPSTT